ncbi:MULTISPECIES: NAD(P)-dependent oxidoreductase [unclassified Fibrobacter]|uniref:NAD-dependent epimerase/dehydratase family protein n=1 Tax=unclassified Fibrobacter TaxID=2634177 RepID=UPI000D6AC3E5|nr:MULTISPECIES: NAD-dependent epimerase/dehydratase family protein [unclassified Fibrobacter]PWJ68533.1 NADH dehydrogenase [Fibrobacter sp. UWR4]PZW72075.1 NADH dehydrogenase [Fibrobacter sp. UWR1]
MLALVTGGAGVVGKALCRELLQRGVCVRVLTLPGDTLARFLPPEVEVFYGDVTDPSSLKPAFDGVDVVYHLAAILLSTKKGSFDRVNAGGTQNVVYAAVAAGVKRLLYVSSISVTYPVLTEYGQSKLKGESIVKEAGERSGLQWTIVRPTLVIGDGGGIEFRMYANYVKKFPVYLLPGGGRSLKKPVRSEDLVKGIASAGLSGHGVGKTYALCGSREVSMAQMAEFVLKQAGKRHLMIPLPWWISRKLAVLKSWIGGKPVTAEQALAGFLYDAVPTLDAASRDLNYQPGTPFEE